jgi:ComF family protein
MSDRLFQQEGALRCGQCQLEEPIFHRAAAYGSYEGELRGLLHLLKYDGVRPAAGVLGAKLADVIADLAQGFGTTSPVAVVLPLHAAKLRQRGFNQSELIARAALKLKPGGRELQLNSAVLVRQRATESQTGLTPPQRRENVKGAFRVSLPEQVAGRDILLMDDVYTTGATVSECSRVLRRAGARRVFVATVARVLKPEARGIEPKQDLQPLSMAAQA